MGSQRAWLDDDLTPAWWGIPDLDVSVRAGLDEDPYPRAEVEVLPTLTVRVRTFVGYDDDGDPQFSWVPLINAVSTAWEERNELDDVSGRRRSTVQAVVPYDGDQLVNETAVVDVDPGGTYRVLAVAQFPERIEFRLERWT